MPEVYQRRAQSLGEWLRTKATRAARGARIRWLGLRLRQVWLWHERVQAIGTLGRMGGEDAAAVIKEGLADQDMRVQLAAAEALGGLDTEAALEALLELLGAALDDDLQGIRDRTPPELLLQATAALGQLQDPDAVGCLQALLRHSQDAVRQAAGEAMVQQGESGHQQLVQAALQEPPQVRCSAIAVLGRVGHPLGVRFLRALVEAEREPDAQVRAAAVLALRGVETLEAEEAIVAAGSDPDSGVRFVADQALGWRLAARQRAERERLEAAIREASHCPQCGRRLPWPVRPGERAPLCRRCARAAEEQQHAGCV